MINELIKEAKNQNISIEVFSNHKKTINLKSENGCLENNNVSDTTRYKIKAKYQGKTIIINTDIISIDQIIEIIKQNCELLDNTDRDFFATPIDIEYKNHPAKKLDINDIISDLKRLNKYKEQYNEIFDLVIEYDEILEERKIINENTSLEDGNHMYILSSEISLIKNNVRKTGTVVYRSKDYDINEFERKLKEEILRSIAKFGEDSIITSKYNIILTNNCAARLLNVFSNMFSADSINKKISPLVDKFNSKVFSDKITIVEDPTNEKLLGTCLFDDEGSKTNYKEIIKDGKFITKLYNRKTALKDGVESTGNSFGVRNLYVKPLVKNFDELVEELNDGIIIDEITGLHSGINTSTGSISIQSSGYLVKNGKKDKRINMIVLSSDIFEIFTNVVDIGNDLEMVNINCGSPSLLIKNITIVGEKE